MPEETVAGRTIEIIKNPSGETIQKLGKRAFTGLTYYPKRQRPWSIWFMGKIIEIVTTKDKAISTLGETIEKSRRRY